ncbi:MAG: hypothetical protein AB1782_20620 [Cyanobacteriota bacterium]
MEYKKTDNIAQNVTSDNKDQAGSLGGTPDKPVSQCDGGSCTIDFGAYLLKGIPEDFGDYVEISGNSGGTDVLVSLLYQLADQLEEKGDSVGAQQFRDLANLGHYTGMIENKVEDLAERDPNCTQMDNFCYVSLYDSFKNKSPDIPENISNLLPGYDTHLESVMGQNRLDLAAKTYYENPTLFYENKDKYSSFKMYELYQNIKTSSTISDNLKSTATEILKQMSQLKMEMAQVALYSGRVGSISEAYDFETGNFLYTFPSDSATPSLTNLTHPQYSFGTHLRSALVCTTGKFDDTGKACK